ncbi:FAD-binding molybdopterin dehydrogenase [Nocardiopsis gilva YIM 90087]|uniref:FAD-binding molybdopterin dehydrogenase n=1 Tax=Nocardiopsis gilva YIM 90087 TaxID=1235441 RepID=A0A223S539_9ACTN|nr:xanthine dehydrogenase family protein subunit M [Nocardiopsis gilva]ASU83129.1 FAD-binding molybdopterin dehydrogenase [Nocardiopsis gilva YIM 90087]
MRPVAYTRVSDVPTAIAEAATDPDSEFLAGGTTEVDMLRIGVARPRRVVDINDLPISRIEDLPDGGVRLGAMARMSDVARAPGARERFPMVAQALELGASAQLRNMASMGGNLMQRVRCGYFRDGTAPCNKREPGSGCAAISGINRTHAVLGTSDHCIATHPSDVAVPLVALDAVVHIQGPQGTRTVDFDDFFLLPGDTPEREHPISHGELITAIDIPATPMARRSTFLKVRDRESYEFALAAAAVAMRMDGGVIGEVRIGLGGVATKPWRARRAEEILTGARADDRDAFERAAREEMAPAVPQTMNGFKIELAQRTMVRALETVAASEEPERQGGTT